MARHFMVESMEYFRMMLQKKRYHCLQSIYKRLQFSLYRTFVTRKNTAELRCSSLLTLVKNDRYNFM